MRPYIIGFGWIRQKQDRVEVIRHDDELVEQDAGTDDCRFHPCVEHNVTIFVENDVILNNPSEKFSALTGTERDEIAARATVIVLR